MRRPVKLAEMTDLFIGKIKGFHQGCGGELKVASTSGMSTLGCQKCSHIQASSLYPDGHDWIDVYAGKEKDFSRPIEIEDQASIEPMWIFDQATTIDPVTRKRVAYTFSRLMTPEEIALKQQVFAIKRA